MANLSPFVAHAIETFGAERLRYGGDWPVSLLAGGYQRMWDALAEIVAGMTDQTSRTALYGTTAEKFYALDVRRPTHPA